MTTEMEKVYDPRGVEARVYEQWIASKAFEADPADERAPFCMVIPPPNVTAALHLGHALNNTLQDILIRFQRMNHRATLWMPGTDHAGIATQTVVEKRILAEEGKHRKTDFTRDAFIKRIQEWKDQYEATILNQLKMMGCSCDWDRTRFTMDDVCAKAVRETFFKLFADGLIYRGKRLVNWDPATQTVLADDEVEHEDVHGHFWYLQYPLEKAVTVDGQIIEHVTVATTRPETMLGDTAVAMNPRDPRADALVGQTVILPIVGRKIPIIADEHVVLPNPESDDEKAKFSTGFLKVTPAHDPDDYQIGLRHDLPIINIMAPDASISKDHGWDDWAEIDNPDVEAILGMDRFEARAAIVEFFRTENLLEEVRDYTHPVGHSYRSHVPIEPYLSDQWYVAVKKPIADFGSRIADLKIETEQKETKEYGIATCIAGTDVPVNSLAGLALTPLLEGKLTFVPERYATNYKLWLKNLRDWPISRQLWWGHQIPVWSKAGEHETPSESETISQVFQTDDGPVTYTCVKPGLEKLEATLEADGWVRDEDVLDTWFSSALWPFSTLGWPDKTPELEKFYPGNVLSTDRSIITLWVSRMVMMGQYCVGDIPFTEVFIHATIQDGQGRKMSKSLGNGVDPLEIIESHGTDAMRYTLTSMTTQTQDVRMPLEVMTLPSGKKVTTSPKFDIGRNLCNKLWNASRFAMMKISGAPAWSIIKPRENLADAWILSRLNSTIRDVTNAMNSYRFSELTEKLYHFLWDDFCDWYLEIAKVRIAAGEDAPKAIVAHVLDMILRMLHPTMPFITEAIWEQLNQIVPVRGPGDVPADKLLITARWPMADGQAIQPHTETSFATLMDMVRGIRNVRTQHNVVPGLKVDVQAEILNDAPAGEILKNNVDTIRALGNLNEITISNKPITPPVNSAMITSGGVKLYIVGIVDSAAERVRLEKQLATLQKGISGVEGKLNNEKFVSNAPDEVVSRERQRLEKMKQEALTVQQAIEGL
ncbi:MAG: valine--tRNA ligase [Phycisphaerae bacterium]|nr:valine--tRNA ligase [Phycisphaerae bacterium]